MNVLNNPSTEEWLRVDQGARGGGALRCVWWVISPEKPGRARSQVSYEPCSGVEFYSPGNRATEGFSEGE